MEGDAEHGKVQGSDGSSMGQCNLDRYNASVRFVRHNGALSGEPHLPFHQDSCANRENGKTDLRRADGKIITSVTDLARFYWPTFFKSMPTRPINLMMQSSVYDSVLAYEFLRDHGRTEGEYTIAQDGLEEQGWKAHESGLAAWGWLEHASSFVTVIKSIFHDDTPLTVDHIVWRTNSNCPGEEDKNPKRAAFIRAASTLQAQAVRDAIAKNQEDWKG